MTRELLKLAFTVVIIGFTSSWGAAIVVACLGLSAELPLLEEQWDLKG